MIKLKFIYLAFLILLGCKTQNKEYNFESFHGHWAENKEADLAFTLFDNGDIKYPEKIIMQITNYSDVYETVQQYGYMKGGAVSGTSIKDSLVGKNDVTKVKQREKAKFLKNQTRVDSLQKVINAR